VLTDASEAFRRFGGLSTANSSQVHEEWSYVNEANIYTATLYNRFQIGFLDAKFYLLGREYCMK
jgi:hypothetical protein